ncbi:hypothetical protein TSAR_011769 [Trichomalopsis sarcophagae]|uniref:ABC transmembrane type-1 domain-containing protein n=1 Tax=Trichomalopsis sarcophagae TaxID=543379 RepID=A0A232EIH8_9HYME|nr:hypothetical protein TSAR_011769 [Trichomalopsis sarcophagae]
MFAALAITVTLVISSTTHPLHATMTKKQHELRNHKNLRLVIPGSGDSNVVLQHPVKNIDYRKEAHEANGEKNQISAEPEEKGEKEATIEPITFFKLFQFTTGFEKMLMCLGVICGIISGLAIPGNIYIFGKLVGSMVKAEMGSGINPQNVSIAGDMNITNGFVMEAVTEFAIGNSAIGVILLVFTYFGVMLFNYVAHKQSFRLRTMYLRSVLHQDIAWYDLSKSGEVASRLTEDVIKFEDGVGEKVPMFLHNVFAFIGSLGLAFFTGWQLTLVCMASVPVMTLVLACIVRVSSTLTRREVEVYAVAGSIAEEVIAGVRTVVAFAGQAKELTRYTASLDMTYRNNIKKGLLSGVGQGVLWLSMYASYALSFWYGVTLIIDERAKLLEEQTYNATTMITVFFSIMMGSINLGAATPFVEAFGISKAAASKVFSVIRRKPAINSLTDEGRRPGDIQGSIQFKDICFEYPSRTDVKISIDGHDLKEFNVKWLRNCFGIVGQEPVLFDTTIAENIRFGDLDAPMEKIVQAAKEANAHNFIMKLPNKYDTLVGERGAQISGGQKQRIAIARALIKNPRILLLDEATSALDTRSESKVQAALDKAHKGRTTIIVAHRLTTIKGADKIIVISEGGVVEEGKHDELMERQGHYYSLVTAQVQ